MEKETKIPANAKELAKFLRVSEFTLLKMTGKRHVRFPSSTPLKGGGRRTGRG